jgi:hypothetical protein
MPMLSTRLSWGVITDLSNRGYISLSLSLSLSLWVTIKCRRSRLSPAWCERRGAITPIASRTGCLDFVLLGYHSTVPHLLLGGFYSYSDHNPQQINRLPFHKFEVSLEHPIQESLTVVVVTAVRVRHMDTHGVVKTQTLLPICRHRFAM